MICERFGEPSKLRGWLFWVTVVNAQLIHGDDDADANTADDDLIIIADAAAEAWRCLMRFQATPRPAPLHWFRRHFRRGVIDRITWPEVTSASASDVTAARTQADAATRDPAPPRHVDGAAPGLISTPLRRWNAYRIPTMSPNSINRFTPNWQIR